MDWPAQIPDLNPIEHQWEHLDRQISGRKPTSKHDLFKVLKQEWEKIDNNVIMKLVDSMLCHCQATINAKGFPKKY